MDLKSKNRRLWAGQYVAYFEGFRYVHSYIRPADLAAAPSWITAP